MQCRQHAEHQPVVQLVHVDPLPEDPVGIQIILDPAVELRREQAGNPADPGVRRLGDDYIVAAVLGGEVGLGIVDYDLGAWIVEAAPVGRVEETRACDHLRLDLDRHQFAQTWGCPAEGGRTFRCPVRSLPRSWPGVRGPGSPEGSGSGSGIQCHGNRRRRAAAGLDTTSAATTRPAFHSSPG